MDIISKLPWYTSRIAWLSGLMLLIMLTVAIGWMVKSPPRIAGSNVVKGTVDLSRLLAMQRKRNNALQESADKIRTVLKEKQCDLPDLPADVGSGLSENVSPGRVDVGGGLKKSDLIALVKKSTVLVVTDSGSGSGFFIAPHLIVTNAHVVEGVTSGQVQVGSRSLGEILDARVIAMQHENGFGGGDYALLELQSGEAPAILQLSEKVSPLDKVIAAGYPGDYLLLWKQSVEQAGIPSLIMHTGEVVMVDTFKTDIPMINHTASTFKGNSGGPLIDQCGRVIGINTLYLIMQQSGAAEEAGSMVLNKLDFSIGAADIIRFLRDHHSEMTVSDTPCGSADGEDG